MKLHFQQAVRALILLSFAALIFKLHLSGEITKFINPKYEMLSQLAAILFLFLFFIQLTRIWTNHHSNHHECGHDHACTHNHDHGDSPFTMKKFLSYAIIVFPLVTGFVLPAKVLDASIANKKGAMLALSGQQVQRTEEETTVITDQELETDMTFDEAITFDEEESEDIIDPALTDGSNEITKEENEEIIRGLEKASTIKMDDRVYNTYYEEISRDIKSYVGRTIEVKGFVYKEEGFSPNQLVISRFLVSHCIADASIIGFLTEFSEASSLEVDTWIEAKGIVEMTTYNGVEMPMIKVTSWNTISEPEKPYLYPLSIRLF